MWPLGQMSVKLGQPLSEGTSSGSINLSILFHLGCGPMATHSSSLAWRTPGMEEPGGLCLWGS